MDSKLRLSKLKNANFKTKHNFLHTNKILEVAHFRFLANLRFLTLINCILLWNILILSELTIADRRQKKEIRHLENELPKWQVLVDSVTGMN